MCKFDILFENRLQRYAFLSTQPNKLHKINYFVRILPNLCNLFKEVHAFSNQFSQQINIVGTSIMAVGTIEGTC